MRREIKNRKAELTSKQLITIIILIVSFAVILIFLFLLGFKAIAGEQSCKNSLTWRSFSFLFKYVISVSCKTQEVCINLGGKCSVSGEKVVDEKLAKIEEIDSIVKEYKKNCDSITGNGKIDYGGEGECGICYVLYFDEQIKKEPLAIISRLTDEKEEYTEIISVDYNLEGLEQLKKQYKCKEYLF